MRISGAEAILQSASIQRPYRLPKALSVEEAQPFNDLTIKWSCELGIGVADPLPKEKDLNKFYVERYRKVMGKAHSFDAYFSSPNYLAQSQSQASWLTTVIDGKVDFLDVGAGFGLLLWTIKQSRPEWNIFAVEPDRDAYPYLKEFSQVEPDFGAFWQGGAFLGQRFDVISISHVLEHLRDPVSSLQVLSSYMKPGGYLMVEVPNDRRANLLDSQRLSDLPHLWFFSLKGLSRLIEENDFEIVFASPLGLKIKEQKYSLTTRAFKKVMRAIKGPNWWYRGWYGEGSDRSDIRVLCRKRP